MGHMMQEKWAQGLPICSVLPRKPPCSRGRPQSLRLKSHFPFLFGFTCFVHCKSPPSQGVWAGSGKSTDQLCPHLTTLIQAFSGGSMGQGPGVCS